ncbi:NACHT domain-containing protein [Umezawaea sp.]|uniref:NACHT domain-containing protein n=1 Tax=Umezawaea sp. TaxID=1955258 RepID=UPI002ED0D598
MRVPAGVVLTGLATSTLATLTAIVINVATGESAPPPLDVLRPHAYTLVIVLWVLTAVLLVVQEAPRRRAASVEAMLAEPARLDQAVEALRGRLDARVRRHVRENRLFPGLPALPQVWRSDPDASRHRVHLATLGTGTGDPLEYVRVFDRVPSRRLVVRGDGGAGKTDWLHTFARGLLDSAEHRRAVPVLLDLSTWPEGRDFTDWVTDGVVDQFPELRTRRRRPSADDLATALRETNRLVLLLDGLDEVAPARRGDLLAVLNDDLWHGQAVVLTSRTDAYPADGTAVRDAAAVVLEPLPRAAAVSWLTRVFPSGGDVERWRPVVRALDDPTSPVAVALATPLTLTLAAKVYESPRSTPGELLELPDADSVTRHLFGRFPQVAYARSRWSPERVHGWLEHLATRMSEDDRHGIAWWRLYLLVPRWRFGLLLGALTGLVTGSVATALARLAIGALPEHPPFDEDDFLARLWLVPYSMVENSVRTVSGQSAPTAAVTAVAVGALLGAVAAAVATGMVVGHRDASRWRRSSWTARGARRGARDVLLDVVVTALLTAAAGAVLGAVVGAFVGLTWFPDENSSALFWIAVRAGVCAGVACGAGVGALCGLFDESSSRWGRPAPDAPTGVRLGDLWAPTVLGGRGVAVLTGLGFAAGAAVGLATGGHPGLTGGVGALVVLVLVVLVHADAITEAEASEPADTWRGDRAEHPRAVLRADLVSSVVRITAASVLALPLVLSQSTPEDRRYAGALAVLLVTVFLAREVCLRSWSWSVVAGVALAARGRLPWRPLRFLEDARDRRVLRRHGGVYRFRHAALQDRLALAPVPREPAPEPPAPPAGLDGAADLVERGRRALALDRAGHHRRASVELYRVLRGLRGVCAPDEPAVLTTAIYLAASLDRRGTRLLAAWRADIAYDDLARALPTATRPSAEALLRLSAVVRDPVDRLLCLRLAREGLAHDDRRTARVDQWIIAQRGLVIETAAPSPHHAAEALAELLADARGTLGAEHPVTAFTRHVLAKALGRANRWAEAEEHYRELADWAGLHPDLAHDLVGPVTAGLATARRRRRF